jgi:hypothetical protein
MKPLNLLARRLSSTRLVVLLESDVLGVLPEALAADVQVVLANDRPLVFAHAAASEKGASRPSVVSPSKP